MSPQAMTAAQMTHGLYEVLKDFQPALAALIALTAAALAYLAAMHKAKQDQRNLDGAHARLKLGLHLRLRYRAGRLKAHADGFKLSAQEKLDGNAKDFSWIKAAMKLLPKPASELDEAWSNLDLLPQPSFEHLEQLRAELAMMTDFEASSRSEKDHRFRIGVILRHCENISTLSENLRVLIDPEIVKMMQPEHK